MTESLYADLKGITAKFADIYVSEGYSRLEEHFNKNPVARIPVLFSGHIAGGDAFNPRKWTVFVDDVSVDTDHAIFYTRPFPESSHFDLDACDLERLDGLAESTLEAGVGILASSNYHAQGHVNVPSHWLRALVSAYRQQNPHSAAFYFHTKAEARERGDFEVHLVSRNHWDEHHAVPDEPLAKILGGRLPSGGTEERAGLFVFRDVHLYGLRSELYDAGFREDEAFSAYVLGL